MKKFILILAAALSAIFSVSAAAAENTVLIESIDSTEAVEIFKDAWESNYNMAARHGFGTASYIGQPFSVEYLQLDTDGEITRDYLFHFPIITNGKIVSYIQQNVSETDGETGWAVGEILSGINELNDGRSYSIVVDQRESFCDGEFAVTVDDVILLYALEDQNPILDVKPYEGAETHTVNIFEPLETDTSQITKETDAEYEFFTKARENGKTIQQFSADDINGINIDGRILVPLRRISSIMGGTVDWDEETKTAYAETNGIKAEFVIGQNYFTLNGEKTETDTCAVIYNNVTYIPIRYAAEALGAEVYYNKDTKMITAAY